MIKIGIIGSRRRNGRADYQAVYDKFVEIREKYLEEDIMLISGGCPKGGDRFAEVIAKNCGLPILIFYPNWAKFGKKAGFVRNEKIAKFSDEMIACVAEDRTGGTENTLKHFKKFYPEGKVHLV